MDLLDPMDVAFMTAELISVPLHPGVLLILSPPAESGPGYVDELYHKALTGGVKLDPRFRRHPHVGVDTAGMWVWRNDDNIDMRDHLQRRTLPAGAGKDALWKLISGLHSEPLKRSRPMWMSYLIDGLEGGRFAFYIKVHHTVVDGVAGFRMIADALTRDPDRRSTPPIETTDPQPPHQPAATARRGIPNPCSLLRTAANTATASLGLVRQLAVGELSALVASIAPANTVLPLGAPYTRFNGRLGPERTFAGGSWLKSRIRAVENAAGVDRHDVLTAMVAGALRDWLIAHSELPTRSLVAIFPITVRGFETDTDDNRHGNRFGLELCTLATDLQDPIERLRRIHQAVVWAKKQVARRGLSATALMAAPSILPTVLSPMVPFMPKRRASYNLSLSNIPGPRTASYFNGALVEEIYPVSVAIGGQALNVTMCSYADRVTFGCVSGPNLMPDIESLTPLLERALDDLESAVGVGGEAARVQRHQL